MSWAPPPPTEDEVFNDALSQLFPEFSFSSPASTSSPGEQSLLCTEPEFKYQASYGHVVGTVKDLCSIESSPPEHDLLRQFGHWLHIPEDDFDAGGTSGLVAAQPH